MKPCEHKWLEDKSGVEICETCRDFRPWQETVMDLRFRLEATKTNMDCVEQALEIANGQVEHKDDELKAAIRMIGMISLFQERLEKATRENEQMKRVLPKTCGVLIPDGFEPRKEHGCGNTPVVDYWTNKHGEPIGLCEDCVAWAKEDDEEDDAVSQSD